jgi:hypothetical protein
MGVMMAGEGSPVQRDIHYRIMASLGESLLTDRTLHD